MKRGKKVKARARENGSQLNSTDSHQSAEPCVVRLVESELSWVIIRTNKQTETVASFEGGEERRGEGVAKQKASHCVCRAVFNQLVCSPCYVIVIEGKELSEWVSESWDLRGSLAYFHLNKNCLSLIKAPLPCLAMPFLSLPWVRSPPAVPNDISWLHSSASTLYNY